MKKTKQEPSNFKAEDQVKVEFNNLHLAGKSQLELEVDLAQQMKQFREKLLANRVINWGIPSRRLQQSLLATLGVITILALVMFGLTTLLSKLIDGSGPILMFALLASILGAFSFGIIKLLHDGIFPEEPNTFPQNLSNFILDTDGIQAISAWFRSFLSSRKQVTVSLIIAVLSIFTLMIIAKYNAATFKIGSYILVFFCSFAVGHGAYCAIGIPTLLRVISKQRMKLFWLSPADTPWIKEASWIFTKLSLADAFIASICIIGLYLLKPLETQTTAYVALLWLLIALVAILYTFIYPHHHLSKIIKEEKKHQLLRMQALIEPYRQRMDELNEEELKKFFELVKLYEYLAQSRASSIDTRAVSGLIPSLAIPTLSFFGREFIELWKRINP